MKIIFGLILMLYILFNHIIQPLVTKKFAYLSEFTTFMGSIIGALGSIIGGIIAGIVAFGVARYQLKSDAKLNDKKEREKITNYKRLILSEIKNNNISLKKLDPLSSKQEIITALKYSISNQIFKSCSSELEVDDFFFNIIKYYRILDRLHTDESIHNEDKDSIDIILEEIDELLIIEEQLIVDPTTK